MDKISQIEDTIYKAIQSGNEITVKWNCGGDEAIISLFINGEQLKYDNPFVQELDLYLINYLNLPDVGEFDMEGLGKFIIENDEVYIEYESIMKGMEDYENGGWKEINEREEMFSGKRLLIKKI